MTIDAMTGFFIGVATVIGIAWIWISIRQLMFKFEKIDDRLNELEQELLKVKK